MGRNHWTFWYIYIQQLWRLVWDWKKNLSRAWFRSTDLWVMGPARFHCATLLFLFPARQTRPHNLHLPPLLLLLLLSDWESRQTFAPILFHQNLDSCRKCHFWSASQNCCSFHGCSAVVVPHPLLKVRSGQNWTSYSARPYLPDLQLPPRGRSSDGRALA